MSAPPIHGHGMMRIAPTVEYEPELAFLLLSVPNAEFTLVPQFHRTALDEFGVNGNRLLPAPGPGDSMRRTEPELQPIVPQQPLCPRTLPRQARKDRVQQPEPFFQAKGPIQLCGHIIRSKEMSENFRHFPHRPPKHLAE